LNKKTEALWISFHSLVQIPMHIQALPRRFIFFPALTGSRTISDSFGFCSNPFITEESVEKEKDIIAQEIRMYEDDPNWRVFFNLLDAFYVKTVRRQVSP